MKQPHKVLAWLFDGDVVRHGAENVLKRIESEEKAKELLKFKRQEDELEDRIEMIEFLASGGRNKLHTVQHNGKKFER
jgi:RNA-binding protein YhbY